MHERSAKVRYFSDKSVFEKSYCQDWRQDPGRFSCEDNKNSFYAILTLGLVIGLPVSPCILKNSELGRTAKAWCYSLAVIKTLMLIVTMVYLGEIFPAFSMRVTFYGYNMFGYITMFVIFYKRKRLNEALQDLVQLSSELRPGGSVGGKYICIQILAFIASVAVLAASVVVFFFYEQQDNFKKVMYVPPNISDDAKRTFQLLVTASITITIFISVSTCGFVVLLSSNIYVTIVHNIRAYGLRLLQSWYSTESIVENLSLFRNLSDTVHKTDSAVSSNVFFLFCTLISGFFNTVTVIVFEETRYRTASSVTYISWIFVSALGTLMLLCHYGSAVDDVNEEVKRKAVQYSDRVLRGSTSKSVPQVLSILLDVLMRARMEVTGGGMFVINNGLTLTIAGVMMTYGVLILQMDR